MTNTTPGNFIWFDLLTSDPDAATNFYTHVIGWSARPMGGTTGYTLFASDQGPLAGVTALPDGEKRDGVPPHWAANVQVDDVDRAVATAKRLGGRVQVEASDYPNVGRLAIITDPQGVSINVFAPSQPLLARDPYQHGEFVWSELLSEDHEAAFAFYSALFGWKKTAEVDVGAMGRYLLYNNGGRDLGGMFSRPREVPTSAWLYYIRVGDLESTLERATSRGARILHGPLHVPGGARIAHLSDPLGALFALHEDVKGPVLGQVNVQ